jgi:hypothetical protein
MTVPTTAGNLEDDSLSFGTMQVGLGKAFLFGTNLPSQVEVDKQWLLLEGRQFLVEEVPVASLADELDTLPMATAQAGSQTTSHPVAKTLILPPRRLTKTPTKPVLLARALAPTHGLVLDYQMVNGSLTNYTFQGDTTYYISGTVNLYGTSTFEGGAVLKYTNNASLNFSWPAQINCLASAYRPMIFTAIDDNSVGDMLNAAGCSVNPISQPPVSIFQEGPVPPIIYQPPPTTTPPGTIAWNYGF